MEGFDFIKMHPAAHVIAHAPGLEYYCLANIGREYSLYFDGRNQGYALIDLPQGNYEVSVFSPDSGELLQTYPLKASETRITMPKSVRTAVSVVRE